MRVLRIDLPPDCRDMIGATILFKLACGIGAAKIKNGEATEEEARAIAREAARCAITMKGLHKAHREACHSAAPETHGFGFINKMMRDE